MAKKPTKNNKKDPKKAAFLSAYEQSFGNISRACQAVPINRSTYYDWMAKDAEFKAAVEQVEPQEVFVDFAEGALADKIAQGDTTAIIFALKTKGKRRGYVEKGELDINANVNLKTLDEFNKEAERRLKETQEKADKRK
jgi:hypothetical protein